MNPEINGYYCIRKSSSFAHPGKEYVYRNKKANGTLSLNIDSIINDVQKAILTFYSNSIRKLKRFHKLNCNKKD